MKKSVPIIAALLMLVSLPSRGQLPELERPEVLPASPEASKLAAYISYPVSLANGLVQTSIPLYEIVDGDIRIPITLSYHASGLKANMRSGSGRPGLAETLSYNVRDQLTGLSSDVFGMTLRYHDPALGSTPRYNGAVFEWEWRRGDGTGAAANAWSLTYDAAGILKAAINKQFNNH